MTLGSRGQLHVSRPIRAYLLVSKYHQANFTSHCIFSGRAYILCKAYDIQSPWKYFPNTYTISSQDGTVQVGCDCTVSYTQEQVSFISL